MSLQWRCVQTWLRRPPLPGFLPHTNTAADACVITLAAPPGPRCPNFPVGWCRRPTFSHRPAECRSGLHAIGMFSGVMAWQDVAQDSEVQKKKKWADAESCLPGRRRINVSTAEVLRQAEGGFGLEGASADKRWLGGVAWFGGVESAVMLKKKLNVDSTYISRTTRTCSPRLRWARYCEPVMASARPETGLQ